MEVLGKKEMDQVENRGRKSLIRMIKGFIEAFQG
jgi:hypothetical protein